MGEEGGCVFDEKPFERLNFAEKTTIVQKGRPTTELPNMTSIYKDRRNIFVSITRIIIDMPFGSQVKLEPTFIYGFTSSISGGAHFVDDETIVYPIGRVMSFHKIAHNTQRYVKVKGIYKINAVTISPNRKVVAVAITGPKPAISFYDTATLKRLMTVGNPAEGFKAKMFEHLAFTQDSIYLVVVTSEPDGLLICYKWATGGVVAHTKADGKASNISSVITVVAPHPNDSSVLAIGGIGVFRLMALYYNEWRQYGFKRAEYWPISCLCWITSELVLLGTRDGRLMVIEDSLMKGEFKVQDLTEIRVSDKEDVRKPNLVADSEGKTDRDFGLEVRGLTSFSQGFAFAFVSGEVCIFQKVDKRHWVKKNVIVTGAPSLWEELNDKVNFIKYIDISPSEKMLLCSSSASEIYYTTIFQDQDPKFKIKPRFELLHNGFHHGSLATLSCCLYKPLFLTVGTTDRACRIWNFETLKLVNMITFSEDILSAAFHPSGWYCLISFDKDVKVFMVLMDSMKPIAVLNVKSCSLLRYSKRGNAFACASGAVVSVFAGTTFEKLYEFHPGSSTISSMHFSANDFVLYAACLDSAIYKYCLKTGQELFNLVTESGVVHDLASSSDGVIFYFVGTDGCLKAYRTQKSAEEEIGLVASHPLNQSVLLAIAADYDDSVLIVGGQGTDAVAIRTPLHNTALEMSVFKLHSTPIIKFEITHVNPTLLSLGRDGVVGIWHVEGLKRKQSFLKYYREVDEVIVNAENWSNKRTIIKEQQEIMARLDNEYDEKLKVIDADREVQETKIIGRFQGVLDIIGLNNKITQEKNAVEVDKMTVQNAGLIQNFDKELDVQRVNFEKRLISEQEDLEKWRCGWDNIKYGFDNLINSVKMSGQCIVKRLEYFTALELTRRANETLLLKDDITQIIEDQKNRELNLIKHSQFEIDELVENSERHEQLAVEIIQLRAQKQKLCEQVEGLESTYFNMQEFLREAQKTIVNLDHRKSQRKQVELKQKKIQDKLQGIRESGKDILDNIEVSKSYHVHHMVSEECIDGLCQINHLLEERRNFKKKEQWLRKELVDSSRSLNRLRYVLSFLSLQNYLHNNALQKNVSREKDKSRKMHFFRTNLKKEIHSMLCAADSGNLKGRLISLCSQYADPKGDHNELLDKLSGNKELWKAITHLEATKLHFGNCVSRMKMTETERSCESMMKNYVPAYDDDVDWDDISDEDESAESRPSVVLNGESRIVSKRQRPKKKVEETLKGGSFKKKGLEFDPAMGDNESSADAYHTSDEESSSCGMSMSTEDNADAEKPVEKEKSASSRKQPLSIMINRCKTAETRSRLFGGLLEEKKLIANRLLDVRKRICHKKNMEKFVKDGQAETGNTERAKYFSHYSKIPMNAIIKALNKEIEFLSKSPECKMMAADLFPKHDCAVQADEPTPNTGHLCSLCKGFDMFTKYFEKDADRKILAPSCSLQKPVHKHT